MMTTNQTRRYVLFVIAGVVAAGFAWGAENVPGQETLRLEVEAIARSIDGKLGVALLGLETRETFLFNGGDRFPMQSVYKFPLAMAVLDRVDKGRLSLSLAVHLSPDDLLLDNWSPMRERYPAGNVDIALSELLRYTVGQSDNNGCDILFRMLDGPPAVDAYVHGLGINGMAIAATEAEMHRVRDSQFSNWCEPAAMARLLDLFFQGKTHSVASRDFLMLLMLETATGPRRIKGMLPAGTTVAHKTGTSFTDEKGVTAATNDVGIVTVPGGNHVAMVIFLADSSASLEARENAIARVARAGYDYFSPAKPGKEIMGGGTVKRFNLNGTGSYLDLISAWKQGGPEKGGRNGEAAFSGKDQGGQGKGVGDHAGQADL
jgi:beta-lactamase class A